MGSPRTHVKEKVGYSPGAGRGAQTGARGVDTHLAADQRTLLSHLPGASFSDIPGEGLLVTHWLEEVGGLSVRGFLEGVGWGAKLEVDPPATSHPLTASLSKHEF